MPARPTARDLPAAAGWPVVAIRREPVDESTPARGPVTHSHAALAYFTGGRTRVEQRGEWRLGAGDVLVVPAGEPHRRIEAQRTEWWGLSFCVSCFAADAATTLLAPFDRVRDGGAPVVHIPAPRRAFLEGLFRELHALGAEPVEAVRRSLLTLILHEIERATGAPSTTPATPSSVVSDALRFIERNCLRKLTLHEVAAAVGKSPAYVTTALTKATGRSAGAWIVSGRMAEARRLLLHSDERVDVIAERVGYADVTHFTRMFRREHGATPAAWRAAQAVTTAPSSRRR